MTYDELMEELNKGNLWRGIKYTFYYRPRNWIREIKVETVRFWERGRKGYSYYDIWGMDYWMSEIMPNALRDLKEKSMGFPCDYEHSLTEEGVKKAEKDYDDALDKMIRGFEAARLILDPPFPDNFLEMPEEESRAWLNNWNTVEEPALMKEFNDGMDLFKEHFFSLWI